MHFISKQRLNSDQASSSYLRRGAIHSIQSIWGEEGVWQEGFQTIGESIRVQSILPSDPTHHSSLSTLHRNCLLLLFGSLYVPAVVLPLTLSPICSSSLCLLRCTHTRRSKCFPPAIDPFNLKFTHQMSWYLLNTITPPPPLQTKNSRALLSHSRLSSQNIVPLSAAPQTNSKPQLCVYCNISHSSLWKRERRKKSRNPWIAVNSFFYSFRFLPVEYFLYFYFLSGIYSLHSALHFLAELYSQASLCPARMEGRQSKVTSNKPICPVQDVKI